jgi:hypothetical protein
MLLGLFITVTSILTAQSNFEEFVKHANFIKEGNTHGYYETNGHNSNLYSVHLASYDFKIGKVVKEGNNVTSFEILFRGNAHFKPDNNETPIYWTPTTEFHSEYKYAICMNEHLIFLSDDPTTGKDFRVLGWFKMGNLAMKDRLKIELNAAKNVFTPIVFTKEEIIAFLKPFIDARNAQKDQAAAIAKKAADEHYQKFGIKGKDVVKLEIEAKHDVNFGFGSGFKFGVIATLKDGSVIKTKEIGGEGYESDYEIVIGCDLETNNITAYPYCVGTKPYNYAGDYVKISVKSKHHNNLSVEKKLVFTYNQTVKLDFSGRASTHDGSSGKSIRIDVKPVKHSETGEEILEYRIYDEDGKLTHKLRLKRDALLKINANGGDGGNHSKHETNYSKNAGNGGAGGNITLNLDPKVGDNYQFDYTSNGGKGGINHSNALRGGSDGKEGKFTKNVKTIN